MLFSLLTTSCQLLDGTPRQPEPERLAATSGFVWVTDSSEHFRLHIDTGSIAVGRRDLLKFQLENDRTKVLWLVGDTGYVRPIDAFIVGTPEAMQRLTGQSANGIAYHKSHVIVLTVTPSWSAIPAHEIFHIIAMNAWGTGPVWLNEGMAVLADGRWHDRPLHDVARELLDGQQLVSLERLIRRFRDGEAAVVYPQAASLLKYIVDQYGLDAVKALWHGDDEDFLRIAGKDLAAVEASWRTWLASE
ncbi:MAG: hypothetical protein WEE89_16115 [Gemmatimonadota bacterium]